MQDWQVAVEAAQSRKAEDIVVLDIGAVSSFTDHFVICSGSNPRQIQAVSDAVQRSLRDHGVRPIGVEGEQAADWVLLDYGDMIVHVFSREKRTFYDLERLWKTAPRLPLPEPAASTNAS